MKMKIFISQAFLMENGYTISNLQLPSEGDTSGIWGQTNPSSIIRNTNFINIKSFIAFR